MGKFVKPDWDNAAAHKMTWTGDFAYHLGDERALRAVIASTTGAHTVTVTTKARPEDEVVQGTWAYMSRGSWRHDVAGILARHFKVTDKIAEVEPGTVYLSREGERSEVSE